MTEHARAPAHEPDPRASELFRDVRRGFSQAQKELPPKYFYDVRGSELFEEITRLEEYYPTRIERALLRDFAAPWLRSSGITALVELGAGNADKTRTLLSALPDGACYVPVDISEQFLQASAERLREEFPTLVVAPAAADMTKLPPTVRPDADAVLFAFLGSTIGNFIESEAVTLLSGLRARMRANDMLLLGADLVKSHAVLEAAYNDARGVTAEFNLNVLHVLNRELGTDFHLAGFRHVACYDPEKQRIEMHLVALEAQDVRVPGWRTVHFARGETLRTEVSCKYTRARLEQLLQSAGLSMVEWCTDADAQYALITVRPVPALAAPPSMDARADAAVPRAESLSRTAAAKHATSADHASTRAPRTLSDAAAWIRHELVPREQRSPRIGAEYELLVQHTATHFPAQWQDGHGPLAQWLQEHARGSGWTVDESAKGAPKYRLANGGVVTLEPGGQLEYATPPLVSASDVISDLRACMVPLEESARAHGLELLACGVDPHNTLDRVPLQFRSERYRRMDEHFARIGGAGGVMMRQTASLQLNLDVASDVSASWRLANALAPWLTALFANSSQYAGVTQPVHSYRSSVWRQLDPARTGMLGLEEDVALEYAQFALDATALLHDGRPFGEGAGDGKYGELDWREHLSTLFPEVRLRGYLELRSIDSLPLDAAADAIHLVCALLWNADARREALLVTGAPDPQLLVRAGERGLEDETLRTGAERLLRIAVEAGAPINVAKYVARTPLPG